jgi:hypothetical protein
VVIKNKPKWAVSTKIFEYRPGLPRIVDALKRSNTEFHQSFFNEETREYSEVPYDKSECVVMYGPIKFIRTRNKGFSPGAFGFKSDCNTSHYMTHLPKNMFFNSQSFYMPLGQIYDNREFLFDIFGEHIFIRPDSGFKTFTGFDMTRENMEHELSSLSQLHNPDMLTMCLIAKAYPIKTECRFVVCSGEVVTGSQYRRDEKLDVRIDVEHCCLEYAEKVAKLDWQLDTCYTLDIFLDEERGPLIGEFNSFACSGLYACDMDKIVEAVNKAAVNEF